MALELGKVKYIHKSLQQNMSDLVLQTIYILDGLSTIEDIEDVLELLINGLRQDVNMRRDIIMDIKNATTDQMGVYASAWKYGPLLDRDIEQRFKSLLENEL